MERTLLYWLAMSVSKEVPMSHRRTQLVTSTLGIAAALAFAVGCGSAPGEESIATTHEAFSGTLADVTAAYNQFKTNFVESVSWCGGVTPCIRVKRADQGNDTVSEGMCYGALASAYLNDRPTFDGLWNLYRTHLDSNGLMNWQYSSSGGMIGSGEATDAAEDCAIALIVADKRGWGTPAGDTVTYHQRALTLIGNIYNFMRNGSNQMKPGDMWDPGMNPSYLTAPYATVFGTFTGNTAQWNAVKDADYAQLAALDANNAGANATGLVPDWMTHAGVPDNCSIANWDTQGGHCRAPTVSYDACRTPWRLAMDWSWNNDSRANARLTKINAWARPKAGNIKAGYNLDGSEYPDSTWYADAGIIAAFVGPVAAASVQTADATYQTTMWNKLNGLGHFNYYSDSIRLYTMMFLSGNMPNPLTIGGTCTPATCAGLGATCGSPSDGCGGTLSCGTCASGQTCNSSNVCVTTCTPGTCASLGKQCGSVADGCGGTLSCGTCASGQTCNSSNMCVASGGTNVALNKAATADSVQSTNPIASGNDSSTTTRWCANDGNLNHWWRVDLGGSYSITGAQVMWERTGTNYKYKVEVSNDDVTYTMASDQTATTSTAQTQTLSFTATGRYVRITATGLPSGTWASFFDFQVYGTANGGDTTAPSAPTNLTTSGITTTAITLNWTASTDNVGVTGYKIFKNGAQLTTIAPGTSYQFTNLTAGTQYTLGVAAYDAAGNTSGTTSGTATTTAASDTQAPSAPSNLTTSGITSTTITLNWTASTDNVGVTGYKIFKNGAQLTTIAPGTSYQFTNLTASTQYTLGVAAYDAAGNTSATTSGTATTSGVTCTPETDTAFCTRLAKNCGQVTANDNCGTSRTVSSCGSCTSPATCGGGGTANVCGGGGTEPCTPSATFGAGVTNSGNFNTTGAYCFRTSYPIAGWGCSNFDGRSLMVNDTTKSCGSMPLPTLFNGYYYFESGPGTYSYASIYWW